MGLAAAPPTTDRRGNCCRCYVRRHVSLWSRLGLFVVLMVITGCHRRSTTTDADKSSDRSASETAKPSARADVDTALPNTSNPIDSELGRVASPLLARQRALDAASFSPLADGWTSEYVAEVAHQRLDLLAKGFAPTQTAADEIAREICDDQLLSTPLIPESLQTLVSNATLTSWYADTLPDTPELVGIKAFAAQLRQLYDEHRGQPLARFQIKVTGVRLNASGAETDAHWEWATFGAVGRISQHGTWRCRWNRVDNQLRLTSLVVVDYEHAHAASTEPWFVDCTPGVIDGPPELEDQLRSGLDHWTRHIERTHRMDVYSRHGLAVGDANGDGRDDIYLCQPGGLPNRLLIQLPDGRVESRGAESGVDWLDRTSSALFVDLDNDSDQDLVVATYAGVVCLANDGTGKFAQRALLPLVDNDPHSIAAADYDADGDVDIYVCVEFATAPDTTEHAAEFVYYDANDGGRNVLFRNDIRQSSKEWVFVNVTEEVGLDVDNRRHSLAASWEDFDNDGDVDLYVANDYGRNCLYENQAGHFANVADARGVVDHGSGMSVSWGDVNHDGRMDLYVGNMFSSAGNRVTEQAAFQSDGDPSLRAIYRRFAKGNSLFLNQASGPFQEVAASTHTEMARWAWSSLLVDVNNDGWDDALVANGYITADDTGDL